MLIFFGNLQHSVQCCKVVFKQEFPLVILRAKASYHPRIDLSLDGFMEFFFYFLCDLFCFFSFVFEYFPFLINFWSAYKKDHKENKKNDISSGWA